MLPLAAGHIGADHALAHQRLQRLVERLHAVGLAGLQGGVDLGDFVFANQVAHGRGGNQNFMCGHAAVAVAGFEQSLRNHRAQALGEHGAHHFFFAGGKHVHNPVHRFGRTGGVQGAEHQVAGFGGGERQADGFRD